MSIRPADHRSGDSQQGIALIMVLIFTILLYVMVAELVTTAQMQRLTGENDALLARIRNQMRYNLAEVYETLIDDARAAAAQADGGAGGGMAGLGGLGGGAAEGGESEASEADSSQDPWYQPIAYSDGELSTNVWVEDENRKLNLLTLISADRDFAEESKARFIRLIDYLREDTDYDLGIGDAEEMYTAIMEWMEGRTRTEQIPRPLLKTDTEDRRDQTVPLQLDELLMLRGINDHLFYDQVVEDQNSDLGVQQLLGLESVLTIHTSMRFDPGNPQKLAQQGKQVPQTASGALGGDPADDQPEGEGIRININTATRPVLRCLFPPHEIPDAVIEGILRYRNEEAEEEEAAADAAENATGGAADYLGDINEGQDLKLKIFETTADLENVPEFANIANSDAKGKFLAMVTTKSDVFTIHLAGLFRRNEERRQFVIRRARSMVVRSANGDTTELYPLILFEDRAGLRIMPRDFEESELDRQTRMQDMDEFAREERDWNPFFLEFYRPRN